MNWRGSTRLATYTHCDEGGDNIISKAERGKRRRGRRILFYFYMFALNVYPLCCTEAPFLEGESV